MLAAMAREMAATNEVQAHVLLSQQNQWEGNYSSHQKKLI
jgi:hypothetical protein